MKTLFTTLIGAALLGISSCACASLLTYTLSDSNEDILDGTDWAVVQIQDTGLDVNGNDLAVTGNVQITVQTTSAFTELSNFGMQAFSFNYDMTVLGTDPVEVLDASNIALSNINPDSWRVDYAPTNSRSEFGTFNIDLDGNGGSRTDLLSFLITGVDGDVADNYAVYFSTHVANFGGYEGFDSAWFAGEGSGDRGLCNPEIENCGTTVVPIPPAIWLFGAGLIGLVGVARRKA